MRLTRKHEMMDDRLKRLAFLNDNSRSTVLAPDVSGGLMDKFWKENVPVITEAEGNLINRVYEGRDLTIEEKAEL